MSDLTFYVYERCSTCRKARTWLDQHGLSPGVRSIVDAPPGPEELRRIRDLAQVPLRGLFNTSGQAYRQGGFKERLKTMTEEDAFSALAHDGMLIKRPLLLGPGFALVGFREELYARTLLERI